MAAESAHPTGPGYEHVLVARDLVRRYGDLTAVDGVSFHIDPGETYGLLGPNGAGKTTTISIVAGLIPAHAGTVTVAGRPMGPGEVVGKRSIGLVPQDLAIYPELTARENLAFFGRLQGMRGKPLARRIDEVLDLIALSDRAKDATKEFS
ncbi:MAG TPA: ABC transporter ATP-binding protein, partial [Demequina sp.]|nr:ABC transporter ATP-binding protein [Demequina sp.]